MKGPDQCDLGLLARGLMCTENTYTYIHQSASDPQAESLPTDEPAGNNKPGIPLSHTCMYYYTPLCTENPDWNLMEQIHLFDIPPLRCGLIHLPASRQPRYQKQPDS